MNALSTETRAVVIEREFGHPPEKIWRALTQPHLLEAWLMKNDFAPIVGHRFNLSGDWGGVLDCEVLEVEPNQTLAYTWDFAHDDPAFDLKSVVTFQGGQVVDSATQVVAAPATTGGTSVTEFHWVKPGGWPVGDYTIEVWLDGQSAGTRTVTIKR